MPPIKRILVVEDEPMIALHIEGTLEDLGHEVRDAATAADAESILAESAIDLAILDYHLQGETSTHLATRLKAQGIPFIICSGTAGLDELGDAFKGARFLAKPFTTEGLLAAVSLTDSEDA